MRKHIILLYLIILSASCFAQTVTKTVGIVYTAGAPAHAPAAKVGSQVAIDTVTWEWYEYNGSAWIASGDRIQSISGCSAPNYTPTKYQSRLVINACNAGQGGPELYYYTGSAWLQINEGQTYTAGTGIDINGSNEISNTLPDQTVVLNEGAGIDVTGTYPNFTLASTITQGLTSLNSQTGTTQAFATGTAGTDFGISSATNTHTFNLPDASASNRGALTATDWSAFNNKVGGSGTQNYLPKFTAAGTVGNSLFFENGSNVGLGTTSPASKLEIVNNSGGSYALTLSSNDNTYRAGLKFNVVRTTNAGIAFDIFNLNSGLASSPIVGGAIGYYGFANTPSTTKYLYLGSKSTTDYQDATLKIAPNGTIAINLPGVDVPNAALQVLGTGNSSASFTARFHDNTGTNNALTIRDDGLSGFGTNTQTSRVDVNGANGYAQLRLRATYTPTGTSDALGNTGDTAWDANYFYIKTAAGWKRSALSTF